MAPRVLTQLGADAPTSCAGRNGGHWRISRPRWTPMAAGWGRRPSRSSHDGGLRRAGPPLAADLRARDRDRHRLVAGGDQGRRPTALADLGAVAVSLDVRRHRLAAARRPRRRAGRRAVGGAAAGARPHADGLEAARTSTSTPGTRRTSSTPTATAAPPRGGTGGWSGCWVQDADGVVRVVLREDSGAEARRRARRARRSGSPAGWTGESSTASTRPARCERPRCPDGRRPRAARVARG